MPRHRYARHLLVLAARHLIGRRHPHLGEFEVTLSYKRTRTTYSLPWIRECKDLPESLPHELAACMWCPDQRALLEVLVRGGEKLTAVSAKANVEKSKANTLLVSLQARGIVYQDDGGYQVADGPWRKLLDSTAAVAA